MKSPIFLFTNKLTSLINYSEIQENTGNIMLPNQKGRKTHFPGVQQKLMIHLYLLINKIKSAENLPEDSEPFHLSV